MNDRRFNRISRKFAHALASYELARRSPDSKNQQRYWRKRCDQHRAELQALCDELNIELFIAVQLPIWDDVEE